MRRLACLILLLLFAGPAAAQPALPAGFEEAQEAFMALPVAERRAIQLGLVWTGDFSGIASGEFGRLTFQGISNFQRRQGMQRPNAILTGPQRTALEREAARLRTAARFETVTDPRTGVRIGVPVAFVQARADAGTGSRWAARDRRIVIDTLINPNNERDLERLFEAYQAVPGQQIDYRLQRPEFFVLTGQLGNDRRFYTRLARRGDDVVGYTVNWSTTIRDLDRINVAIANAFEPGAARAPGTTTVRAPAEPPEPPVPRPPPAPDATAVVLPGGRALAPSAAVEGCRAVMVGGRAVRIERQAHGLALLALGGDAAGIALSPSRPAPDTQLVFLGHSADGLAFAPAAAVRGADGMLTPVLPLQAGQNGGALLDRGGQLVAVVLGPQRVRTVQIGGVTPAQPQRVVEGTQLEEIAGAPAVTPAEPRDTADIVVAARGAVLPVACRR